MSSERHLLLSAGGRGGFRPLLFPPDLLLRLPPPLPGALDGRGAHVRVLFRHDEPLVGVVLELPASPAAELLHALAADLAKEVLVFTVSVPWR